jgi:hypothetical protein
MEQILNRLKNDDEDYKGEGKLFLSNSDINALLNNPKEFKAQGEETRPMIDGRYIHQYLLEPEKCVDTLFVDTATRNNKEYKTFIQDNGVDFCFLAHEIQNLQNLANAMKSNLMFYEYIYAPGNTYEVPAIGQIKGEMWKGKADVVMANDFIIDVKTTSDINKFRYSAKTYNYDSQAYIYEQLFGKRLIFLVIDKETSQLGKFDVSDSFLLSGELKVEAAIKVFNKYYGINPTDDILHHHIAELLV